jgi:predicted nucleic acid-binding protein
VKPTHLADASALLELHQPAVGARLVGLLVGGQIATCGIVDLDLLAHLPLADHADALAERRQFPHVPCDDAVLDRSLEVQGLLGRPIAPLKLLVAATAEAAGLVLLHHDPDYERIATVTGQPIESVVPPGGT